jgi:hypothetical protein
LRDAPIKSAGDLPLIRHDAKETPAFAAMAMLFVVLRSPPARIIHDRCSS